MEATEKTALILTGGRTDVSGFPPSWRNCDHVIAADSGMAAALALSICPDLLVGDFDSMEIPEAYRGIPVCRLPAEKDETDTMTAARKAAEAGFGRIRIFGGTGGRLDHTLSNLFLLEELRRQGIGAQLCDGENLVLAVRDETVVIPRGRSGYFSVLPLEDVRVTVTGAKYPLHNRWIRRFDPFAVSNEVTAESAAVTVFGSALLIESDLRRPDGE